MSAEEIQRRLEAPVSYRTDPVRLPVALDEIGALVGVRIRCEAELQPAVVVVAFRNRPAKEAIQHLMDGIGAGSFIQNGTLHVGIRVATELQSAKQKELEIKAIRSSLENRAKQLKIDEAPDPSLPARTAAQAQLLLQAPPGEYRPNYYNFYGAARQSPAYRAAAGILKAVGPELLQTTNDRPITITMKDLDSEQQREVTQRLTQLEKEQAAWSQPFTAIYKMLANNQNGYIDEDLLNKSISLKGQKPDNFQIVVSPTPWGRSVTTEITSAGGTLFEVMDALPKQRVYTDPGGEPFSTSVANGIVVPLSEKVQHLEALRFPDKENKPKPTDWNLMRQIADPWKNEPIAFTRAQPMADVMLKLNLNFSTYLSDSLISLLGYPFNGSSVKEVRGEQVLSFVNYAPLSGLRKKGDWVVGYCSNPESYLDNQINRAALGKFLNLALKPGALTFDQFLAARKEMGSAQLGTARQIARLVRTGFDSLNPINVDLLEAFVKLRPGMMKQMETVGVPVSALPPEVQRRFMGYVGYARRSGNGNIPPDSIDAMPTLQEVKQAKVFVDRTSQEGVLSVEGMDRYANSYSYAYYQFHSGSQLRAYNSPAQVISNFANRPTWPARSDQIMFRMEIQRKRTQMFGTNQFITDVSVAPLNANQFGQLVQRYFN